MEYHHVQNFASYKKNHKKQNTFEFYLQHIKLILIQLNLNKEQISASKVLVNVLNCSRHLLVI